MTVTVIVTVMMKILKNLPNQLPKTKNKKKLKQKNQNRQKILKKMTMTPYEKVMRAMTLTIPMMKKRRKMTRKERPMKLTQNLLLPRK